MLQHVHRLLGDVLVRSSPSPTLLPPPAAAGECYTTYSTSPEKHQRLILTYLSGLREPRTLQLKTLMEYGVVWMLLTLGAYTTT